MPLDRRDGGVEVRLSRRWRHVGQWDGISQASAAVAATPENILKPVFYITRHLIKSVFLL